MREAPQAADLCWRELAIVAKALADGRDMTEIGLMREIALRTIAVLGDAGEPRGLLRPGLARNRKLRAGWKIGACSRRPHRSATAKLYCPSSSTGTKLGFQNPPSLRLKLRGA
jgi:hypothetical protein